MSAISWRVANSSFEYVFRRAECLAGYASDRNDAGLFGDLKINQSSVTCRGLGVEAKSNIRDTERIVSASDASRFVDVIHHGQGWTFEVWATFHDFSTCPMCENRHVASIGSANAEMIGEECSATSDLVFLQLNTLDQFVAMRERSTFPDQSCKTMKPGPVTGSEIPTHVVFTSDNTGLLRTNTSEQTLRTTCWYINGLYRGCEVSEDETLQWEGGGFYLQLMNDAVAVRSLNSTLYAAPAGILFLIAMYNRTLSEIEVAQNFDAGLEDSPPVAEDVVVIIDEDGEIGDHYETPALYLRNPMVVALNLSIIYLLATDVDHQEGYPGFDPGEQVMLPDVYIDSLPSRGTLYNVYGEAIERVPYFVAYDGGGYPVRYRPAKDEFSGPDDLYTSFKYSAVDGVTGETSVVPGIVGVYVLPKNDPPVPKNISSVIQTGETLIFLDGVDVDSEDGDGILGFSVVELPTQGTLYQVSLVSHAEFDAGALYFGSVIYTTLSFHTGCGLWTNCGLCFKGGEIGVRRRSARGNFCGSSADRP